MAPWSDRPVQVFQGRGCVSGLPGWWQTPVLLVTGTGTLQRSGLSHWVDGESVHAFERVLPNATPAVVEAARVLARTAGARTVVGLGGGSALDAAKSVAMLLARPGSVQHWWDGLAGSGGPTRNVRLAQVPTTAGTGSEVTRWASLWSDDGAKHSLDLPDGLADVAFVDGALSDSMGARLTAATGLDAVAHALEALWNRGATVESDGHACTALRLARQHLLACVQGGADATLALHRDGMARAALEAGLALAVTASAGAHALSYGLTGKHGVPHGLAVGLLCRALLPQVQRVAPQRVALILDALGEHSVGRAQAFLDDVFLAADLQPSLAGLGAAQADLPALAAAAAGSTRLANHPGSPGPAELLAALESVR